MKISAFGIKSRVLTNILLAWLGFAMVGPAANVASPPKPRDVGTSGDLLTRGDHNDSEILRFRRIRVERQEVIVGQSGPLLCRHGNALLLTGAAGKLARSRDGGKSWKTCGQIPVTDGAVRALTALRSGTALAAVRRGDEVAVLSSTDGNEWQPIGRVTASRQASDQLADLIELRDGTLLLCAAGKIHRSSDGGKTWTKPTDLPTGWSAARLTQLSSGKVMAAVLFEGPAAGNGKYRNTFLAESSDGGETWTQARGVTRLGQIPGNLAELPDGRLVLSYSEQTDPYGARAIVSRDEGQTWGKDIYVLGAGRYGPKHKPRPVMCKPASGVATVALPDGMLVSAFQRGQCTGKADQTDQDGTQPAIKVVRWRTEGLNKPPLVYPGLWTTKVDTRGYIDNGMVRMRLDDRFEGGDYIEEHEMIVCRRLAAQQLHFPYIGKKGVVICRHPDGSLIFSSREPVVYRSTDEGLSWEKVADIDRAAARRPSTWGFGVTSKGTFLCAYCEPLPAGRGFIARSEDQGRTWTHIPLDPAPMLQIGHGDSCRIVELSDGTIVMSSGNAWAGSELTHWATARGYSDGDVIHRSHDDGRTWGDNTVLPPGPGETNFLELPSGKLMIATRYQRNATQYDLFKVIGPQPLPPGPDWPSDAEYAKRPWWGKPDIEAGKGRFKNEAVMISSDGGYSFSTPELVTRMHMVSADLALMPDGRVLMTYDHKDAPHGVRALISPDEGRTWEGIYILGYGFKRHGRSSSAILKDGRIYTMYAGSKSQGVMATIWSPE